jgi:hypothetical protein
MAASIASYSFETEPVTVEKKQNTEPKFFSIRYRESTIVNSAVGWLRNLC